MFNKSRTYFTFILLAFLTLSACSSKPTGVRDGIKSELQDIYYGVQTYTELEMSLSDDIVDKSINFRKKYVDNEDFIMSNEEEELYQTLQQFMGASVTMYSDDEFIRTDDAEIFKSMQELYNESEDKMSAYFP